ncbi:hypothetical protein IWY39_000570 [Sphingobium sp. JAI105]|uniref:hypothetical protein n=1 Tax=Sphingobium sp. JAI105 TaxID=2787715 RepID=UPI001A23FF7C|nr:hypothetical protein [Sphingobium sp. JAI105]MBG6116766.1 hypothetical protein [Sphingobium sp. JAI105]
MKKIGALLIVIGALLAAIALLILPSTVNTEEMRLADFGGMVGTGSYSETYNLARAQLREMIFLGGIALSLAGVLLFVGGALGERLERLTFSIKNDQHVAVIPESEIADVPSVPSPEYIARDPEDEAKDALFNKVLISLIFVPIAIIGAILLIVAQNGGLQSETEATMPTADSANAAENASQAADEAMNAALRAADNAARAAR